MEHLKPWTNCRDVTVWGRSKERLNEYQQHFKDSEFKISSTLNIKDVTSTCNLIVTATASRSPLLIADDILPGTHITAVGADGNGKQELDSKILAKADIRIVDSVQQCSQFGETSFALAARLIPQDSLIELGTAIANPTLQRKSDKQITVVDLTGLAVQDVQIAKAVLTANPARKWDLREPVDIPVA